MDNQNEDEFEYILDPETNKRVPLKSAIGTQIIKNYLECIKNGPDSKNIISTKMFYKKKNTSTNTSTTPLDLAKKLSTSQYELEKIYKKDRQNHKNLKKGSVVWVKRSSGKWQRSIVYEAYKKDNEYYLNTYINTGDGNVASKKGLPLKSIVIA